MFAFLRFCIYSNPNAVDAFECLKLVVWTRIATKIEANDSKIFARNWRQPETSMKLDFTLLSITREKWNFHELFMVLYYIPFLFSTLLLKKETSGFLRHFRYLLHCLCDFIKYVMVYLFIYSLNFHWKCFRKWIFCQLFVKNIKYKIFNF